MAHLLPKGITHTHLNNHSLHLSVKSEENNHALKKNPDLGASHNKTWNHHDTTKPKNTSNSYRSEGDE